MAWTQEQLTSSVRESLHGRKLIIVSNREPYIHRFTGRVVSWSKAVSGLVTALDPVAKAVNALWIAYGSGDADRVSTDKKGRLSVPPHSAQYTLRRVWLTKEQVDGYYYGYANQAIWPLSHIAYRKPRFLREHWVCYEDVNKLFAEIVLDELGSSDDLVVLQDYHLARAAFHIKASRPDAMVGLFWHIPWPNAEVFRICPQKQELLEGLLANDLLGFHIRYHCHNFLETVEEELEAKVDWEEMSVLYRGHKTLVRPFPISVDFEGIVSLASTPQVKALIDILPESIEPSYEFLLLGVDRFDYTKGLVEKFLAVDRLLERYPEYRGKVVLLQVGALSRIRIPEYKELVDNLHALAEQINWKYRENGWYPIVLAINRFSKAEEYNALYQATNACLVTALHDGLNLVAKEFVSSRVDEDGVLLLSRFTGSARELEDAILINPFDVDGLADAIHVAITMPAEERKHRMRRMRNTVAEKNIYRWAANFISELLEVADRKRHIKHPQVHKIGKGGKQVQ